MYRCVIISVVDAVGDPDARFHVTATGFEFVRERLCIAVRDHDCEEAYALGYENRVSILFNE